MRRFLITAAFVVGLPGQSSGQVTGTTAPQQSVASDSAPDSPSGFMFRVGGIAMSGQRNYAFNNAEQSATGNLKGVEVILRGSGAGISARSMSGSFTGQPDVISADANLLLGPQAFTVSLGGSKRALSSTLGTQVFTFGRVGVQMSFLIGGTGFRAQIGGWGYVPLPSDSTMNVGGEGEGSIIYTPHWAPIYLQFGYRNEVFTSKPSAKTLAPEEVRGLRLGGGIQFGGK